METINANEKVFRWEDLSERQRIAVIVVHDAILPKQGRKESLDLIFELARPKVVFGPTYCRIHADSVEAMKLIVKTYLY